MTCKYCGGPDHDPMVCPAYAGETDFALRDHFAGLAMQALVVGAGPRSQTIADHDKDWRVIVAHRSYAMADEMLRERDRVR